MLNIKFKSNFKNFKNKKVLITGHTGLKGSWLCLWLRLLNAKILGISNSHRDKNSNYKLFNLGNKIIDKNFDIENINFLIHFRTLFYNMADSSMIFVLSTLFSCFTVVTSKATDDTLSNNKLAAKEKMDKPEYQRDRSSHKHYQKLKDNIVEMRKRCGSLCEDKRVPDPMNDTILHDKGYHPVFDKSPVVCESLWNTSIFEQPSPFQDPVQIVPKYLQDYYSYYGGIK